MYNSIGDNMTLFAHRLKELREQKGLKQKELAKLVNVSQKTISAYETGRAQPPSETLQQLAKIFGVTVDFLLGLADSPVSEPLNFEKYKVRYIPIYNGVCAGNTGTYPEGNVVIDHIPIPAHLNGKFGIRVYGDSMEPDIKDGDFVVVDPDIEVQQGDKIVVILEEPYSPTPCAFVKIFRKQNGFVVLQSINPNYPPIVLQRPFHIRIVGKVVGLHRKY